MEKIETLKETRFLLDKEIKEIEKEIARENLYKEAVKTIRHCYRFYNGTCGSFDHWHIYAIVKGVRLIDSLVYMVVDQYEITAIGEIIIKLNYRLLQDTTPMHCWTSIPREMFEIHKSEVLRLSKLREK